ncbi:hypothetical protein [Mangrovibacterium lignilyticum]|uniref:hypothetical protein n=1 Tax=Mangrovibacterium lignilyticum TaxID=2668052 RepID=UPI0013D01452|nr:hypothetical protein [Mangrovibacterium lignilyticum]
MKKQFIQIFGLALLLSACSGKTYQALEWKEKPVAIDGHQDDWRDFLRYFDKDSKMFYEIDNDNQNLYFAISTRDQSSQQKIMQKGLTFGIDMSAGKDYPIQVKFPYSEELSGKHPKDSLGQGNQPDFEMTESESHTSSKPSREHGLQKGGFGGRGGKFEARQKFFVKGFFPEVADSVLDVHNPYGIAVSMQLKDSTLFVEGQIPLKTFYKEEITAADTLKPVNFQFLLSALDQPGAKQGGSGDRPDGPSSGGKTRGAGPGGMMGGGGPGGMPPRDGGMGRSGSGSGGMSGGQKSSGSDAQKSMDYGKKEISLMMRFALKE